MPKIPFPSREQFSLEGMQTQFSHLIERLWHSGFITPPLDGQDWAPPVEVHDEPDRYVVFLEVPGLDRATLDVTAQPTRLIVSGEKLSPAPGEGSETRVVQSERRYGSFRRQVNLPSSIRVDALSASLNNGLLEVKLPKVAEADPVNVRVNIDSE